MSAKRTSRERAENLLAETVEVVTVPARRDAVPDPSPAPGAVPVYDPGPPPIETLWGIGRPSVPPPSRKDGKRRSGDYVLNAQRIKAGAAARPGDPLNPADLAFADGWMKVAVQPLPDEMAQVGAGGELIPAEGDGPSRTLRNTVEDPT
jgi:hypothetical protein